MTPETAPDLIRMLTDSRRELNEAAARFTDAEAAATPQAGGWSALECVEHVTFVEERFLGRIAAAAPSDTPGPNRTAELVARLTNREARAEAPEVAQPKGRFTTMADALAAFNEVRVRTLDLAKQRADELSKLCLDHPRFGKMDGVGMVVVIAGHCRRHAEQIRTIRK
jgi:uncharacterized damage-inducible protein DinB